MYYCNISHIYENIYLGDANAAMDMKVLKKYQIKIIITVADYIKINIPIEQHLFPFKDKGTQDIITELPKIIAIIENNKDKNILIHCRHGVSRSPSIVIGYLIKQFQIPFQEAYKIVKEKRNCINPNKGFMEQLQQL